MLKFGKLGYKLKTIPSILHFFKISTVTDIIDLNIIDKKRHT